LALSSLRGIPLGGAFVDKGAALLSAAMQPWHDTGLSHAGTIWQREAENEKTIKTETDQFEKDHPIETGIGKAVAGIAATAPFGATALGARALGMAGEALLPSILKAAATFGTLNAGDTALRGGNAEDIVKSALIGAASAPAFPLIGKAARAAASWLAPVANDFRDTAFATHEAIPGADTGHMTGSINAPAAERAAYSADPRSTWANAPGGRDAIYAGLSTPEGGALLPVRPTQEMQGLYTPPGGVTEANPGWAARPQVARDAGKVTPADALLLNAGEATRGYFDAQNASAWHALVKGGAPGDSNSLFIPMRGKATPQQLIELEKVTTPHGLPNLVDTGQGTTATRFWPPPESIDEAMHSGELRSAIKNVITNAEPHRVEVDSNLIDYTPKWQQGIGSGAATRELLSHINALPPELREAFNNNPLIPPNAMNRMTRDQDWMTNWSVPREDIQNARRIAGEGTGWVDRIEAALKAGAILPAVAAAILGAASHAEHEQS
jgi:hypothetical protein